MRCLENDRAVQLHFAIAYCKNNQHTAWRKPLLTNLRAVTDLLGAMAGLVSSNQQESNMQRAVLRGCGDDSQSAASALAFAFLAMTSRRILRTTSELKGLPKVRSQKRPKTNPKVNKTDEKSKHHIDSDPVVGLRWTPMHCTTRNISPRTPTTKCHRGQHRD
jgi:hypothetical protein